jgi:hypothetical protein
MTEKQRMKMIDQIGDYILEKQFAKHEVSVSEALTVLAATTDQIIRSLCDVIGEDANEMVDVYCNALQQTKEDKRTYTTGSKEGDELMAKIVAEMKAGGDIEEIVDKYVDCKDPEMRQQLIEGMTNIREKHQIDNVKIGYES